MIRKQALEGESHLSSGSDSRLAPPYLRRPKAVGSTTAAAPALPAGPADFPSSWRILTRNPLPYNRLMARRPPAGPVCYLYPVESLCGRTRRNETDARD
ncbi:MAG: hypothetical protein KJ970_11930 [Candidatus Eisenbacteria bacterium]|uniref:Uncharacterized protein n=1 Tax=Eiseniibacteriota bacterium TaxID=2212470 RepID=A0A948RV77_UNCEI|nr:hypothetical protein [Candidatus Eisenbacteria bacterium]